MGAANPSSETDATPDLEALKRKHFTPEGKAERIARAMAAARQLPIIRVSRELAIWAAESPDLEDDF